MSLPEQYPIDRDGRAADRPDAGLAAIDERRAAIGLRALAADIARYQESGSVNEIGRDQWEPWPTAQPSADSAGSADRQATSEGTWSGT